MTDDPLRQLHDARDAEYVAFGPHALVETYGPVPLEYAALHRSAGVVDFAHRGVLALAGRDRRAFLNNLVTNDVKDLQPGATVDAFFLNNKGRVAAELTCVDDGATLHVETLRDLVPVLRATFDRYLFAEQVTFAEPPTRVLGVYGLNALAIVADLDVPTASDDLVGRPGFKLLVPLDRVADVWTTLLDRHGQPDDYNRVRLRPIGWAALNAARIEHARPLAGVDFDLADPPRPGKRAAEAEETQPTSATLLPADTGQLARCVSFTKGCYLGQEVVARMHARGALARKLVALKIDGDLLPVAGAECFDDAGKQVGLVTSSTVSPALGNAALALALLRKPHFDVGRTVTVPAEGKMSTAHVVDRFL